jgi:CheY-like chemotaxis protein
MVSGHFNDEMAVRMGYAKADRNGARPHIFLLGNYTMRCLKLDDDTPREKIMLLTSGQPYDAGQLGELLYYVANSDVCIPSTVDKARQLLAHESFTVLVCDLKIDDTLAVLQEFRANLQAAATRILVISTDERHRQAALKAGANLFMLKPVSEATLLALVKGMIHTPHLFTEN